MSGVRDRRALLGRLGGLGWFARHGEVATTAALAMLLEEPALQRAVIDEVEARTDRRLQVSSFLAEFIHDDQARPDLEGQDEDGRPLLVVEAKFAAALTVAQVASYLDDQRKRLDGRRGVLVLLVPAHRHTEAEALLRDESFRASGDPTVDVALQVITWDELLDLLDAAAEKLEGPLKGSLTGDLLQLRGLCLTLSGLDIPPLGDAVTGVRWKEREEHLRTLVDQVTAYLSDKTGPLLPTGRERTIDFYRRYIRRGNADSWTAVGVVAPFADDGLSPFWMRYHKKTPGFAVVRERVLTSPYAGDARFDNGHVWVPLRAPSDVSGTAVVADLARQVRTIDTALASRATESQ